MCFYFEGPQQGPVGWFHCTFSVGERMQWNTPSVTQTFSADRKRDNGTRASVPFAWFWFWRENTKNGNDNNGKQAPTGSVFQVCSTWFLMFTEKLKNGIQTCFPFVHSMFKSKTWKSVSVSRFLSFILERKTNCPLVPGPHMLNVKIWHNFVAY